MSTNTRHFTLLGRMGDALKNAWGAIRPGPLAWKGAALGLLAAALPPFLIAGYSVFLGQPHIVSFLVNSAEFLAIAAVAGALVVGLVALIKQIPTFYGWALVVALVGLYLGFFKGIGSSSSGMLLFLLVVIVIGSLLGAAAWVLLRGGWRTGTALQRIITLLGLALGVGGLAGGISWLMNPGQAVQPPLNAAAISSAHVAPLAVSDPSQPGPYPVRTLFYGAGTDRQRPEYGPGVALVTGSVDGTPFTQGWSAGRMNYWGFGPEALPINGRVWYPDGAGPFPLVLIVHGDHFMQEFSDPGYDYLGELLASRGFILASIDANFLNSDGAQGLPREENDARGWLMLEHLRFWQQWNQAAGSPFYGKVDMKNIAVMGHSRGGEAAPIAAEFNRLPYYPDDATVAFHYNFNIRSVVAIAPVFETYKPRGRDLPLENVNYFVLQGSNDSQILSFMGLNQYSRVSFTDGNAWFKSALYIYGANHAQFNSVWVTDEWKPVSWLFNRTALISFEDQQRVAKVYISAFLEATLRGQTQYLPLFRDYRAAPGWLPETIYLNQFQDSTTRMVSTYEEDINAGSTTMPGGAEAGENLTVWREQAVNMVISKVVGPIDNTAVFLGWDAAASGSTPSYTIRLPGEGLSLDANSTLVFSLADANEDPDPRAHAANDAAPNDAAKDASAARQPIDLTVEGVDRAGHAVRLPLSSFSYLQPQIVMRLMKAPTMNAAGPAPSEPIFESFEFPLVAFAQADPSFDPASLTTVRFIFDRTPAGVVVLDDVGFRN